MGIFESKLDREERQRLAQLDQVERDARRAGQAMRLTIDTLTEELRAAGFSPEDARQMAMGTVKNSLMGGFNG